MPSITARRRETCGDLTTAFAKDGDDTSPDVPTVYVPPVPEIIDAAGMVPPEIESEPYAAYRSEDAETGVRDPQAPPPFDLHWAFRPRAQLW